MDYENNMDWLWLVDYTVESKNVDSLLSLDFSDILRHGMIVSNLAVLISRSLGGDEEFQKEIAIAGLLHDIGKLKLGRYLYGRRKDTMNIEEMKYVRMHPTFSYNILKSKGKFSDNVLQAVYSHHENFDGSGYPNNLKGEEIPMMARIIRTSDVFASLVSDRTYRTAFDFETAMDLMIDEVKNFDMRVFLAFQQVINGPEFEIIKFRNEKFNEIHNRAVAGFGMAHPDEIQDEAG